mgnify:CR=1 FL=1
MVDNSSTTQDIELPEECDENETDAFDCFPEGSIVIPGELDEIIHETYDEINSPAFNKAYDCSLNENTGLFECNYEPASYGEAFLHNQLRDTEYQYCMIEEEEETPPIPGTSQGTFGEMMAEMFKKCDSEGTKGELGDTTFHSTNCPVVMMVLGQISSEIVERVIWTILGSGASTKSIARLASKQLIQNTLKQITGEALEYTKEEMDEIIKDVGKKKLQSEGATEISEEAAKSAGEDVMVKNSDEFGQLALKNADEAANPAIKRLGKEGAEKLSNKIGKEGLESVGKVFTKQVDNLGWYIGKLVGKEIGEKLGKWALYGSLGPAGWMMTIADIASMSMDVNEMRCLMSSDVSFGKQKENCDNVKGVMFRWTDSALTGGTVKSSIAMKLASKKYGNPEDKLKLESCLNTLMSGDTSVVELQAMVDSLNPSVFEAYYFKITQTSNVETMESQDETTKIKSTNDTAGETESNWDPEAEGHMNMNYNSFVTFQSIFLEEMGFGAMQSTTHETLLEECIEQVKLGIDATTIISQRQSPPDPFELEEPNYLDLLAELLAYHDTTDDLDKVQAKTKTDIDKIDFNVNPNPFNLDPKQIKISKLLCILGICFIFFGILLMYYLDNNVYLGISLLGFIALLGGILLYIKETNYFGKKKENMESVDDEPELDAKLGIFIERFPFTQNEDLTLKAVSDYEHMVYIPIAYLKTFKRHIMKVMDPIGYESLDNKFSSKGDWIYNSEYIYWDSEATIDYKNILNNENFMEVIYNFIAYGYKFKKKGCELASYFPYEERESMKDPVVNVENGKIEAIRDRNGNTHEYIHGNFYGEMYEWDNYIRRADIVASSDKFKFEGCSRSRTCQYNSGAENANCSSSTCKVVAKTGPNNEKASDLFRDFDYRSYRYVEKNRNNLTAEQLEKLQEDGNSLDEESIYNGVIDEVYKFDGFKSLKDNKYKNKDREYWGTMKLDKDVAISLPVYHLNKNITGQKAKVTIDGETRLVPCGADSDNLIPCFELSGDKRCKIGNSDLKKQFEYPDQPFNFKRDNVLGCVDRSGDWKSCEPYDCNTSAIEDNLCDETQKDTKIYPDLIGNKFYQDGHKFIEEGVRYDPKTGSGKLSQAYCKGKMGETSKSGPENIPALHAKVGTNACILDPGEEFLRFIIGDAMTAELMDFGDCDSVEDCFQNAEQLIDTGAIAIHGATHMLIDGMDWLSEFSMHHMGLPAGSFGMEANMGLVFDSLKVSVDMAYAVADIGLTLIQNPTAFATGKFWKENIGDALIKDPAKDTLKAIKSFGDSLGI